MPLQTHTRVLYMGRVEITPLPILFFLPNVEYDYIFPGKFTNETKTPQKAVDNKSVLQATTPTEAPATIWR